MTHTTTQTVITTTITTPLGSMLVGATDGGVCLLEFTDREGLDKQLKKVEDHFGTTPISGDSKIFPVVEQQLAEYFAGKRRIFTVPLEVPGTDFQKKVWRELRSIPYGETRSYQEQAENIQNPTAVRAVASTNGNNRIAILIPCHRVIGKNGSLTGYSGGLWRKKALLELERNQNIL